MNIDKINSTTFNGYKNVLAFNANNFGAELALMSVQLTNTERADLDNWKEIQQKLFKNQEQKDTITVIAHRVDDRHIFSVNLRTLANMQNNAIFTKAEEPYVMKLYTLLANITKRINNGEPLRMDFDAGRIVAPDMIRRLWKIYGQKMAIDIVNHTLLFQTKEDTRACAVTINKSICKIMKKYFA